MAGVAAVARVAGEFGGIAEIFLARLAVGADAAGLLGVSGISGDMRTLLASAEPLAKAAVELFVFRATREIAALANTLGGLESLVFTGGIGEHAAPVRAMIAARLNWLGVAVDAAANDETAERIDSPQSRVEVRVMPTNEELTIARHVARLCQARLADG